MAGARAVWDFPASNGGVSYGLTDAASTYFQANRLRHVIREVIQNSLDAHDTGFPVVRVQISDCMIPKTAFGGDQLADHFTACLKEVNRVDATNAQRDIEILNLGLKTLMHPNVRCLTVVDSGTRGLPLQNWRALVESEGIVQKAGSLSGGSFGIGKNAVFTISDIFTVIYSTRYLDGKRGRVEKCQGKARLMTHAKPRLNRSKATPSPRDYLQNTGFYRSQGMKPLIGKQNIPDEFRLHKANGTGVFILGFNPHSEDWVTDVQRAVCESFFMAIHQRRLSVTITPESGQPLIVDHETIDEILGSSQTSRDSYYFYKAVMRGEATHATSPVQPLGTLDIFLNPTNGPSRIAYVNRKGMLITASSDQKINPIAPRRRVTWTDYTAVVTPQADEGDRWIRNMESPAHDAIQPDQLPEPKQQQRAKTVFRTVRKEIREIIDSEMEARYAEVSENLSELAPYLPERDGKGPPERNLAVTRIQTQPVNAPALHSTNEKGVDARTPPERKASHEGSGDNGCVKGEEGKFVDRRPRAARRIPVHNPRLIPVAANQVRISFSPPIDESRGPIALTIHPRGYEATAEAAIPITEAKCLSSDQTACRLIEGNAVRLVPDLDDRISILLTTSELIEEVSAFDLLVRETQ